MIDKEVLQRGAAAYGVSLDETALDRFDRYAAALLEMNTHVNLTALKTPEDVCVKHFVDSLTLFSAVTLPTGAKVLDVGTGAGFPGAALLMACPDLQVTLLDGTRKKLDFVRQTLDQLDLPAEIVHARAETAGHDPKYRTKFDLVTARAVAALRELCEYCLPFTARGGTFVAMKGALSAEELDGATAAIRILGGKLERVERLTLDGAGERTLVVIKKISQTPTEYPRPSAKIAQRPLENGRTSPKRH